MAAPLVSLLIPTYNSALTVADAIASCRNQTWSDLEIVIYDEVSKDQTRDIIVAAAKADSRIRVLTSETNSGPVLAWRKLLHEARGKYLTFVWSDDLILPRYCEALLGLFQENPSQVIAPCNAYSELLPETVPPSAAAKNIVTGEKSRGLLHHFPSGKVKGDTYALGILTAVYPVSQICALFESTAAREVFDHYINFDNPYGFNFSRHAYGNDVSFASELALRSGELLVCGEPLVACRASPDSMTVNARRDHRWQYWLQYVWAIRAAWTRCRSLSPRMDALIRVVDDRVSFCEFVYAFKNKRFPKEFSLAKIVRALWFLSHEDRRLNPKVTSSSLEKWLSQQHR